MFLYPSFSTNPLAKIEEISPSLLTKTTLVVESAITDVLSIIIALGILKTFQSGHQTIMEFIGTNLIATMAMSLAVGFGGAVIWSTILEKIRNEEAVKRYGADALVSGRSLPFFDLPKVLKKIPKVLKKKGKKEKE